MGKLFDKIIAVSLNPALDVTLWVRTLDFNEPNFIFLIGKGKSYLAHPGE